MPLLLGPLLVGALLLLLRRRRGRPAAEHRLERLARARGARHTGRADAASRAHHMQQNSSS